MLPAPVFTLVLPGDTAVVTLIFVIVACVSQSMADGAKRSAWFFAPVKAAETSSDQHDEFGMKLVDAARAQVAVPVVYDLCWNISNNTVLFFSTNSKAQSALEDLFKETFEVHLILEVPYLAAGYLLPAEQEDKLADLTPAIFI